MPYLNSESERRALSMLPKAELHLHLEGCLAPELLVELGERHGEQLEVKSVADRYHTTSFSAFLELFKWGTSYLRAPEDYARLAEVILTEPNNAAFQYKEITLSVGVMLLRKQDVEANFAAIQQTFLKLEGRSKINVRWIFDAVRQFGPEKAMEVARIAAGLKSKGVVAFGLGGDEEALPAAEFRKVYEFAASEGLHRVVHAGEMSGPQCVWDAIEILGAERIGHGIASLHDEKLMNVLIERRIPLEICPQSNVCTGALARLLGVKDARIEDHPLRRFIERGVPVTLSSDDPAMFHTSLDDSYEIAMRKLGVSPDRIIAIAEAGFRHSFLAPAEKNRMIAEFRVEARRLGLL
jgi:aminodeoxyfutalosine deaminase